MPEEHDDEALRQVAAAIGQWSQNQEVALQTVRGLADNGNTHAAIVTAWMFSQLGRAQEGLPYAQRAVDAGAAAVANNYGAGLLSDPAHRAKGVEFLRRCIAAGWPIDPLGYSPTPAQQGDFEVTAELVKMATLSPPGAASEAWEEVFVRARSGLRDIESAAAETAAARETARAAMHADAEAIQRERERVEALVLEVADLVHGVSAGHLAKEYADHAVTTQATADGYTRWAIVTGVAAVVAAFVVAIIVLAGEHGVGSVLSKGALTLPLVALAAYLGSLGRTHRRMAWHWRHMELQIRTATPFIAPLDDDRRTAIMAALALRFFPGQSQDPQGNEPATPSDPAAFLGELAKPVTKAPDG